MTVRRGAPPALLAAMALIPVARETEVPPRDPRSAAMADDELLRQSTEMVDAGLAFLASRQNEDRSFSIDRNEEATRAPLAVTALAALAFMAGGSTMGRGPYQSQVRSAVEYLLDNQVLHGEPGIGDHGYFKVQGDDTSRTHGHGFATLAVAEAYGTLSLDRSYGDAAHEKVRKDLDRMREALIAAVSIIERSQSREGGWEYEFDGTSHEGSVTIALIQALRAARDVGIAVDKGVIERAVAYVRKSQRATDGGFRYQLNHPQVTYALTAAAIATLNASGDYDSDVIDLGIEYMKRNDPVLAPDAEPDSFPFYARLYAAQAYWFYRDPLLWERWHPAVVRELANSRIQSTGAFQGDDYGRIYATAMSCLILSIPFQYLPIFQR
jgi:hypothetical protein